MNKPAETQYEIHDLLKGRWSPRAFASRPVEDDKLLSLFEAARWTSSAANGQPWAFVVTTQAGGFGHQALVSTLTGRNPAWAAAAPILVLVVAKPYPHSGSISRFTYYDVGQAVGHLTIQAEALGLRVHQMGGYDADKARQLMGLPDDCEPMTVIAIGYPGDPDRLPEDLRVRELAGRTRNPLEQFVFKDSWGQSLTQPVGELSLQPSAESGP